jgi:soluble P-type ATPase
MRCCAGEACPFAAPLALFEGVVAEFIPIVGTYIGGAVPVLVALLYDPVARLDGAVAAVGGPALLREYGATPPAAVRSATVGWIEHGATVLYVLGDKQMIGAIALEDQIRPESWQAVEQLHWRGVRVVMITGDARQVADTVGRDLAVDEVFAEVLPEAKDSKVAELQARGLKVAMVGDGVNDAPALARADVGIAIGAGTDVAIESAGVVLASDDPRGVVSVITLSRAAYRKMLQNLGWATGYNLITVPLAAGVLTFAGFVLPPTVGAILMSGLHHRGSAQRAASQTHPTAATGQPVKSPHRRHPASTTGPLAPGELSSRIGSRSDHRLRPGTEERCDDRKRSDRARALGDLRREPGNHLAAAAQAAPDRPPRINTVSTPAGI